MTLELFVLLYVAMAFTAIQFSESEGGSIALVCSKWLTPRKREVFWPPTRTQSQYLQVLKSATEPNEKLWKLYTVTRSFFSSDDYEKSNKKLKLLEETSDVQSETEVTSRKRPRKLSRRLFDEDFDYNDDEDDLLRPPKIPFKYNIAEHSVVESLKSSSTVIQSPSCSSKHSEKNSTPNVSPVQSCTDGSESSSFGSNGVTGFQIKIVQLLKFIQEQNSQIIALLHKQSSLTGSNRSYILPEDLPVKLPLGNITDLNKFEEYLDQKENLAQLISYFSTLGGKDTVGQTNNILRKLLTNQFAQQYSFYGKRGEKRAFSGLKLKQLVIGAVKLSSPQVKERDIEDGIKVWLKHSPQRFKAQLSKQNTQ